MKKFRTILSVLLAFAMVFSLAGCGGSGSKTDTTGANSAPKIAGVKDLTVEAGTSIDVLAGVTASDAEDGDVTSLIKVDSTPALTFSNGKATPDKAGDYELSYTVTDKGGLVGEAFATLTVTRKTGEAEVFKKFDFSTRTAEDAHGWEARVNESAKAEGTMKQGAFVFDIEDPGDGDGAVQLVKPGFALEKADYRIKVWAKSTAPTYAHFIARDESVEEWSTFGAVFNARIEETVAPIELNFSCEGEGSAELMLNLGKITPNPDNAADTTPENFSVTIDKIEIYKITGEENEVPLYTADFKSGEGLSMEAGDGAAAEASFADGSAQAVISAYPTEGGVWSIKANLGLGDLVIEEGVKYYYRFTVAAENGLEGECLVESLSQYHEARANFNGLSVPAGEEKEISVSFTAEHGVSDPVIRLQIGNPPADGVTANTITFTNVEFGKLEGDKEVDKTIESFAPIGKGSAVEKSEECPWETFNGTDEDNEHGVGTIWTEDGSLFYRIDDGGSVDWHNKLICPITLPSDSYFTVEITAKASKPVSCGFFLNPSGGWDPRISEGIDFTTEEKTFSFTTTDPFITDMGVELLFQFGSAETAALGEVTIEFTNVTIYQMLIQ
ncbi:MAG: hypothetical protein IJK77_03395 [Lachnospiraceae bacterium]|nr:hypothetical protein [Lachnospiraceae bacterium]